ncbi:P-loop containing nucleoside triphosphate hydrolase protein [Sanghuangporus baumii]|uniref:ATP-dependent DNA helicase n=1 Tax=Sanghuangporus baumii TaxID=108892 RepID=A0A9Q5N5J4_SANBA|nr:P-loop containing nucleoside triphosphate hydrolase protein [Sanghuangporus baumii]
MSDSFYEGDDDEFADSAFLKELDVIEAAASQRPSTQPSKPSVFIAPSPPASESLPQQAARPRFKPAIRKKEASSDDFDEPFDIDAEELNRLDAFIADSYVGKAQPVAGPSRTRQTTLDGKILSPPLAAEPQVKRSFARTKSSGPIEPIAKTWDRTTFSETGFRSTKKKGAKAKDKDKDKGKGKNVTRDEDFDEDFGDEEMEFEQFPSPHVDGQTTFFSLIDTHELTPFSHSIVGPPPPMRLKPDLLAAKDWIFPLNHPRRDYQFNIVKKCLFQNTLVALPTGLGKTFVAGVIMLNYYRWFPEGRIFFVAPTKPLVAQQISACHEVCGIPGSDAALLTGEVPKSKRSGILSQKRVIYMTPQTLVNDLASGLIDPLSVILIVIDEAHRGSGDYAYSQVVRYMMAKNPHFRILALSATPGNTVEAVQRIVDSLHISHIEIRNEQSFDLQKYIFQKMEASASACYRTLKELKENLSTGEKNDDKYVHLLKNSDFMKLMEECERQESLGFSPHPKVKALVEIIMGHFNSPPSNPDTPAAGGTPDTTPSDTRVMIFVELREVVDEILGVLDQYKPMLRASMFVGQGVDRKGKKGMAQAKQLEIMRKFREGEFNVLVSTSVGEEGLDVGEIDRIICYDCSKSSIKMLQRVGRTGRKRTGYVDVLLSEEREERNWDKSKENYQDVQQTIICGNQLELYTDVERLLPDNIQPECLQITMPIEEYDPEANVTPRSRKGTTEKKRKRNNDINRNVPLGAFTGFVTASKLRPKAKGTKKAKKAKDLRDSDLEDDSDDEEIAHGLRDVISTPKKRKSRSSESKKPVQCSLLDMLNAPIPDRLEDDEDDLDIQNGLTPPNRRRRKDRDFSDSSNSPVSSVQPRKRRRTRVASSSSSSDSDTAKRHAPSRVTSLAGSSSSALALSRNGQKKTKWLLDSGSEAEILSGPLPSPKRVKPEVQKPDGVKFGFRSAKSLGVVESVSSSDEQEEESSTKADVGISSPLAKKEDGSDVPSSVPEPTYAVGRRATRKRIVQPDAPPSSPIDERKEASRRLVRRRSSSLMPPPIVSPLQGHIPKKPKLNMTDNPMLFDVEATHSGDEVSGGDGSDIDMAESDSDRHFLEELPETQVSPSYNQIAAYRAGLMTQALGNDSGPLFKTKKKRVGPFAGGRTQVSKPPDWSSSPVRGSEPDEYEMGSFVVQDDDMILEQSSEP